MKLKTLKNLKNQDFSKCNQEFVMGYLFALKDSSEEAIKWIKEFDELDSEGNIKNKEIRKFHGNEEACWIQYFFNITEENLKVEEEDNGNR